MQPCERAQFSAAWIKAVPTPFLRISGSTYHPSTNATRSETQPSAYVECDKNFEGFAQLASEIAVDLAGMSSGWRWPERLAHALPGVSISLSCRSYEHLLRPANDWPSAARVRIRGNAGSGAVTST